MKFPRFRHEDRHPPAEPQEPQVVQLDPHQVEALESVFSAPRWLRDLGIASWLLVGAAGLLIGLVLLLAATATIVDPVVAGLILAVVSAPAVNWFKGHGVPRWGGAVIVVLALIAIGALHRAASSSAGSPRRATRLRRSRQSRSRQGPELAEEPRPRLRARRTRTESVKSAIPRRSSRHSCTESCQRDPGDHLARVLRLVRGLQPLLPAEGRADDARWIDAHLGVPLPVAQTITGGVITSLRRYFLGVTIVAAFNAVVVGLGALLLDVPLAGTIAVVTFVTAYVPFIGAFVSGRVRGRARARLARDADGAGHARDRHPCQRAAAEHRPADRVRRDAEPQPARRPDRDDRRRAASSG